MTKVAIITKKTKDELKTIKGIFNTATRHENNENYDLSNYYEEQATNSVEILSKQINLGYDLLISLIFDFDNEIKRMIEAGVVEINKNIKLNMSVI